jgi:hypothetical protein
MASVTHQVAMSTAMAIMSPTAGLAGSISGPNQIAANKSGPSQTPTRLRNVTVLPAAPVEVLVRAASIRRR